MSDDFIEERASYEAEVARLRGEIERLEKELAEARADGIGWREFERVRRKLGEIISDNYAERSMWPRLTRVERWYSDMQRRADAAEASLAALRVHVGMLTEKAGHLARICRHILDCDDDDPMKDFGSTEDQLHLVDLEEALSATPPATEYIPAIEDCFLEIDKVPEKKEIIDDLAKRIW